MLGAMAALVTACGASNAPVDSPPEYGPDSWRERIAPDCLAFFDGCNHCRREPGASVAACTRKACSRYDEPHCLDD
jgi:hypothetical protein